MRFLRSGDRLTMAMSRIDRKIAEFLFYQKRNARSGQGGSFPQRRSGADQTCCEGNGV
jgi:hypothetical protein